MESAPPPLLVLASNLYTFSVGYYSKSKECLKVVKVLPDTHNLHFKIIGLELSPCLFNLYARYFMLGWKKHKLESRLLGEISITSDMQMIPPLWQKVKRK